MTQMKSPITLCGKESIRGLRKCAKCVTLLLCQGSVSLNGRSLFLCLTQPSDSALLCFGERGAIGDGFLSRRLDAVFPGFVFRRRVADFTGMKTGVGTFIIVDNTSDLSCIQNCFASTPMEDLRIRTIQETVFCPVNNVLIALPAGSLELCFDATARHIYPLLTGFVNSL